MDEPIFDDIPSVRAGLRVPQEDHGKRGVTRATGKVPGSSIVLAKYLVMAIIDNPEAMVVARDLEIVAMDDEYGLWLKATPDVSRAFSLSLWKMPSMRTVFDTLGLEVVGGEE